MEFQQKEHDSFAETSLDLYKFIETKTLGLMSVSRTREVLCQLITGPEKVCDLWNGSRRVGVGILLDTFQNMHNSAELTLIAENNDERVLDALLQWALPLAKKNRKGVDLPEWQGLQFPQTWLERNGFIFGYSMNNMEHSNPKSASEKIPVPAQWSWCEFREEFFNGYYALVKEAFKEIPGAFIPDEAVFRKRTELSSPKAMLLLQGKECVGFVRVEVKTPENAELAILGRNPKFRGQGVGPLLVQKGLELLVEMGAKSVKLEVAASNEQALQLYKRFGFKILDRTDVFQKTL